MGVESDLLTLSDEASGVSDDPGAESEEKFVSYLKFSRRAKKFY